MRTFNEGVRADLVAIGIDPDDGETESYVQARGWKVDPEALPGGPAPTRALLIDHNGDVVGHGWGRERPEAVLAAFADYLDHTDTA